jgi:hypothetical protein
MLYELIEVGSESSIVPSKSAAGGAYTGLGPRFLKPDTFQARFLGHPRPHCDNTKGVA